mmetsp:Transcript_20319/g.38241  ORF Transcript_20319/g.38241 Transcript_20319/m.38241 type:complete len:90 (-) Transcript_20319:274-543(-)
MLNRTVYMLHRRYNENGSRWDFQGNSLITIQTSASATKSGATGVIIVQNASQNPVSFQLIAKCVAAHWFRHHTWRDAITTSSQFLPMMK